MENYHQNTNQIFIASKNSYGEGSVTYMGVELVVYNPLDRGSELSFSWGNTNAGSEALAYAILNKVSSRDIAYKYAKTYMEKVIAKINQENWNLERVEVLRWINENTNFSTDENASENAKFESEERREEDRRKEERRIQREKDFQDEIQKKLKIYEEKIKEKENEKARLENIELEKENEKVKLKEIQLKCQEEINTLKEEVISKNTDIEALKIEIEKYKLFIDSLDIKSVYEKYSNLDV